ncbi:hypothetical protein HY469_00815 [Candidatus Roizmanbacteria bacterium]|nr:hypothetical protein [Candidatus Roizmanbacteria bacterium]
MGQIEQNHGLEFSSEEAESRVKHFSFSASQLEGHYGIQGTMYDLYDPEISHQVTLRIIRDGFHSAEQSPLFQVIESTSAETGTTTKRLVEVVNDIYDPRPAEYHVAEQLQSNTPTRTVNTDMIIGDDLFRQDNFIHFQYFVSRGEVYVFYLESKSPQRTIEVFEQKPEESYKGLVVRLGMVK